MSFRRVLAAAGALVLAAAASVPAFAQDKPAPEQQQQRKLTNDERRDYIALTELVDAVIAGKQPAPADVKVKFQNHFLKSSKNVYVPYILELSGGTFSSFPVTMYVRAVQKPAPGAAPAAPPAKGVEINWPFADVYFVFWPALLASMLALREPIFIPFLLLTLAWQRRQVVRHLATAAALCREMWRVDREGALPRVPRL